jgi:acyl carrier protein
MDHVYRYQVVRWLSSHLAISREKVGLELSLFHDLGVTGDDACELMAAFSKHFGVDLTEFHFEHHFTNEGYDPTQALHSLISDRRNQPRIPLTVADLIEAAKKRAWLPIDRPAVRHPSPSDAPRDSRGTSKPLRDSEESA